MDTRERVDNFLAHYTSENYDPVKAHEYYLKNRELKGRNQSTSGMSEVQKEAWAYTKNKIGNDKKAELDAAEVAQKARMEALRKQAEETRDRIKQKLETLLKKLNFQKALPLHEIPENATRQTRARLTELNKRLTETNKRVASENSAKARKAAGEELMKVGTEMKDAIAKARDSYVAAKKQMADKYKAAVDTEYQNIRTKLPSAPPPVKKAPSAKKTPGDKKPRAKRRTRAEMDAAETEESKSLTKTQ